MPPERRFRPDIQALRALAVSAVLLFHAGIPGVAGGFVGVDVFFVISGFLITTHLVDEIERHGRVRLGLFYARRARRILPAAMVVLALSVVAVVAVVPAPLAVGFLRDAAATAVYAPNIAFAIQGTDYLAEAAPSPFQHYWSLGVEEQFYLGWPLLLGLLWLVLRRRRARVVVATALLVAVSFVAGVILTQVSPPWAFFSVGTRAWELGVGALVALGTPLLARLPGAVRIALTATGLLGIVATATLYSPSVAFPGVAAALPTLATAAVIAGGCGPVAPAVDRAFGVALLQYVGRISYSLYLVHWPLLVIPAVADGRSAVLEGVPALVALAVTVPLAAVLYALVEQPFQRAPWSTSRSTRSVLVSALAGALVLAVGAAAASVAVGQRPLDAGQAAPTVSPSSVSSVAPVFTEFVPSNLEPSLATSAQDVPRLYADGCRVGVGVSELAPDCRYGDVQSSTVVALYGDSHAAQWFPALERLAVEQGFRLDVYMKTSCPSSGVPMVTDGVLDVSCDTYRENVLAAFAADPPDRLVISNFAGYDDYGTTGLDAAGWSAALARTLERIPTEVAVTVITDTPQFAVTPSTCLAAHLSDALTCSLPRSEALDVEWRSAEATAARAAGAQVVDLSDVLCDAERCGLIVGNRLLYRDAHHLTASFAELLAPALSRALAW